MQLIIAKNDEYLELEDTVVIKANEKYELEFL